MDKDGSYKVLMHEFVHCCDYVKNPILFPLKYLFPQILSLISLGALGAFWNPWFLLCLVFLLCLLPLPARWRSESEMRGYTATMAAEEWQGVNLLEYPDFIDNITNQFTGMSYYRMNPDEKVVHQEVLTRISKIKDGSILKSLENKPYLDMFVELENINNK